MMLEKYKNSEGFTLMELTVAMGVFAAAMAFATGAFVQALKTQRTVNHLMAVNSNASLAMEQIAREIRTGYYFGNTADAVSCSDGDCWQNLKFKNHKGENVAYRSDANSIQRGICSKVTCDNIGDFNFVDLTASNVSIGNLCFIKTQTSFCDPWRITLLFKAGSAKPELSANMLNIQTTISARILPEEV